MAGRLVPLLLLLLLSGCVHTSPVDSTAKIKRPLLWSVSDSSGSGFVFGTIHTGVDAKNELPEEVFAAIRQRPCFAMESDIAAMTPEEMTRYAVLPRGESLSGLAGKDVVEKLRRRVDRSVSLAQYDRMRPWFASVMFLKTIIPAEGPGMDADLAAYAAGSGADLFFLEDWRDAVKAFDLTTSGADLAEIVNNPDQVVEDARQIIAAYRAGDEVRLAELFREVSARSAEGARSEKILLHDRNKAWLPHVAKMISQAGCFIAVGAGHLSGPDNLLDLLKKRGFKVRRVGDLVLAAETAPMRRVPVHDLGFSAGRRL